MSQCDFHRERGESSRATTRVVIDTPDKPRTQHLCDECVETYRHSIHAIYGRIDPREIPEAGRTRTLNRFIDKIDFPDTENIVEECWEWDASTTTGYGQFRWDGSVGLAHRYAFLAVYGYLPAGDDRDVMHECENRACTNPAHLWEGTRQQNARHAAESGVLGPKNRFDEDTEREIRDRYETEDVTQDDLADEYDTTQSVISLIVRGKYR